MPELLETSLKNAVLAVLRPLVRYLIGQGWAYPALSELLKTVYVAEAEQHYGAAGQRPVTDSRISLLTGIHRKDVKRLRKEIAQGVPVPMLSNRANLAARVVAAWVSTPRYLDAGGEPKALPLRHEGTAASFESLVREARADLRPKAVLDELIRVGVTELTPEGRVRLLRTAYVSSLPEDKLAFLGSNVGDHLQSAIHNILTLENPFIERAVYYEAVPAKDLADLRPELTRLADQMLRQANKRLMAVNTVGTEATHEPRCRMRLGVYYFEENTQGESNDER